MRNMLKATTLESKFPLLAVEQDCIISKDADITVAFRVELPELFTITATEYEAIHAAWVKAIKVMPNYSIVHKQDWYLQENYTPNQDKEDMSFLNRSFELHFNEHLFCLAFSQYSNTQFQPHRHIQIHLSKDFHYCHTVGLQP